MLEACRARGMEIAAFCYDDRLSVGAHCRSCLVEMDGCLVPACTTAAREGMVVRVDTPELRAYRRDLGELMVSESSPGGEVDDSHPYLRIDLDACIRCRRCVRICEEVQGSFVYAMLERGAGTKLGWAGGPFAESGCVSCGACTTTCPTGAITDVDRLVAAVRPHPTMTTQQGLICA